MTETRIEYEFDNKRFMADVRRSVAAEYDNISAEKISLRDIEAITGVSASSFSRVDNGGTLDMDSFIPEIADAATRQLFELQSQHAKLEEQMSLIRELTEAETTEEAIEKLSVLMGKQKRQRVTTFMCSMPDWAG